VPSSTASPKAKSPPSDDVHSCGTLVLVDQSPQSVAADYPTLEWKRPGHPGFSVDKLADRSSDVTDGISWEIP
jgi:hypothetical protein